MPHRIVPLAFELSATASAHAREVATFISRTRMLAINALIESAHAGAAGSGFAVIANEVKEISQSIGELSARFTHDVDQRTHQIEGIGEQVMRDMAGLRGDRLADLALNMIDVVDRNLYERSCDVRWWATDAAVVSRCGSGAEDSTQVTTDRLAVILDNYTVYLDIWVCDPQGRVLATGRPGRYPATRTSNVSSCSWFRNGLACAPGAYAVDDIGRCRELDNRQVAIYAAPVRAGGLSSGETIGVLAVFFDWQAQSQAVVDAVRLTAAEKSRTRCLIVDAKGLIIAASDHAGVLTDSVILKSKNRALGHYHDDEDNEVIAFALTPGYETYKGLGWYGVLIQTDIAAQPVSTHTDSTAANS
jgi:hypothetical protein